MLSRRDFLSTSTTALLAASASAAPERPPNIILFLTDDMGCHDLNCLGAADLHTPNIDRLGENGARFTNWYAAAPVCAPSRAALLTGRYPIRAGLTTNGTALPENEGTVADCLKKAGYATALVGKWHLGSTPSTVPNARGFDRFFGFHSGCIDYYSHRYYWGDPKTVNYHDLWSDRTEVFEDGAYSTELFAREAVAFVREHKAEPFFLLVAFNGVHYPMHAPRRYRDRFPGLSSERGMYAAMLSAVDDAIGEVMREVDTHGLSRNTLTVFTADNGATRERRAGLNQQPATSGSNAPYRGFKFSAFDGGIHPPMLMNWPGKISSGQLVQEVGCHIDLLPTFCEVAGASLPADRLIDGRNALPMATERARTPHEALYWSSGDQLAIRRANWKLVKNGTDFDGSEAGSHPLSGDDALFLSDLASDPGETSNYRHKAPAVTDQLATEAARWLVDASTRK
jgi:arylsulfatase A-like enzyme